MTCLYKEKKRTQYRGFQDLGCETPKMGFQDLVPETPYIGFHDPGPENPQDLRFTTYMLGGNRLRLKLAP